MYGTEQQKQVDKVLQYIEQNLSEPLPLEKLAKISTYSAYHFQRLFKSLTGENPASYVKRLRMENAAHLLIYEYNISVTDVAFMSGFTSLSYFTYAFNQHFHTSPKKWREGAYLERFPRAYDSKNSKPNRSIKKEEQSSTDYNKFTWLDLNNVKTMEFPVCLTINRRRVGPYTEGITNVWEDLYHWANSREFIKSDTLIFGVPRNNPYITPPDKSQYDCRVEIDERAVQAFHHETVYPFMGGKHVVYTFEEPVDYSERSLLIECYSELYSFWLPKSGYRYLGNPIELIQMKPVCGSLSVECKIKAICLAIEPK
ncbi:AraC family transcriptional regulator [Paenibacillus lemnae]|uniref:AraC family transcriptional regulator n=1 Tax=Paenibacillus lemnae TaxID=1330551 RepID=A0A848M1X3_PAELE|nr:AraC family transcriptional regulator [Paenibacillus lemnae]NMO94251.1 AraC family transcriptional regulator [Paenibacillus lemnae]